MEHFETGISLPATFSEHRDLRIDVVVDSDYTLAMMDSVEAANILLKCPPP